MNGRKEVLGKSSMKTIVLCMLCTTGQGKGKPEGTSTVPSPRERVSSQASGAVQYFASIGTGTQVVQGVNWGPQLVSCCGPYGDRNHPEGKGRGIIWVGGGLHSKERRKKKKRKIIMHARSATFQLCSVQRKYQVAREKYLGLLIFKTPS
ncbi:hypothetical protein HOY82DRAFT_551756 [Tuber indicum]|nr:hypothetical protein HOY82DRAFT_551756 [Tuber indicum]